MMTPRRRRFVNVAASAISAGFLHWPLGAPWWATAFAYVCFVQFGKING